MTRALTLALLVLLALPADSTPQSPPAAPFLPQDHWSLEVVRSLLVAGTVDAPGLLGRRTLTRTEVVEALRAAAAAPAEGGRKVGEALERFLYEFPTADPTGTGLAIAAAAAAGGEALTGRLRTGTGVGVDGVPAYPPVPLPDHTGPLGIISLTARAGVRAAALLEAGHLADGWSVASAHATVALGPVLLWGGRRPVGFGPGAGGGIVLGDRAVVDGGGLQLARAARGPGALGVFGPVHFETLLGREGPSGQVENPWFWAARGSLTPHPRLTLGINRGALFGGEGNVGGSLTDLLYIIIGKHAGGGSAYENQVVSVDVHYRPPLPIPAEAYVEWGFEDSAGAWRDTPGTVWGVAFGDLPGLPGTRLGIERADFARSCCGNPMWYRHMLLLAGWTQDAIPLGHPLGGHGEEWLLFGSGGLLEERLHVRASLALRDRWSENLYAPDREGRSRAGTVRASFLAGRWTLASDLAVEDGSGWTETAIRATVRYSP
ncbi:MAG TPA: capsule assembly Wzi family protein [Longimicrobiales bacterium]|nr:capsule assembly Wzi family protein [Longimicrobiales bacterium]